MRRDEFKQSIGTRIEVAIGQLLSGEFDGFLAQSRRPCNNANIVARSGISMAVVRRTMDEWVAAGRYNVDDQGVYTLP